MKLQGKQGPGAFQWNLGGWFGAQLGATLWLAILGCVLVMQGEPAGWLLVACAFIPNLIGTALWYRRNLLAPYPAIQTLLGVCGLAAAAAMLGIRSSGLSTSEVGLPSLWFLLMYPGLMVAFLLQERSSRGSAA